MQEDNIEYFHLFGTANCPFCVKAINLMNESGFLYVLTLLDNALPVLKDVKKTYNIKTVPIITKHTIGKEASEFIGGCSDLETYLKFHDNLHTTND
jgi:glutaredoxin